MGGELTPAKALLKAAEEGDVEVIIDITRTDPFQLRGRLSAAARFVDGTAEIEEVKARLTAGKVRVEDLLAGEALSPEALSLLGEWTRVERAFDRALIVAATANDVRAMENLRPYGVPSDETARRDAVKAAAARDSLAAVKLLSCWKLGDLAAACHRLVLASDRAVNT